MDIPKSTVNEPTVNESTVNEPLKFFQWMFIDPHTLWSLRDNYLFEYELSGFIVDYEKDAIKYETTVAINEEVDCEDVMMTDYFRDSIMAVLDREFNIFSQNLSKAVDALFLQDNSLLEKFLRLQQIKFEEMAESSKSLYDKFPFVKRYMIRITEEIKKKKLWYIRVHNEKPKEEINSIDESVSNKDDKYSIIKIFGFYRGRMESEQEYNRLINHITQFVETNSLPDEQFRKFKPIHKIQKELIRYTFYILWSENQEKINRMKTCEFIHLSFEDFSGKVNSIYSKLKDRPQYLLDGSDISEFIRNYDLKD